MAARTPSPLMLLGLTLPLAVFLMILLTGYTFLATNFANHDVHHANHPLHGLLLPGPVIRVPTKNKNQTNTKVHDADNVEYHIVFSTGCSAFQDWQSYVFFFQALKVQQPGTITRIVSGCQDDEEATVRRVFQQTIAPMSSRFRLHFTPDYAGTMKQGLVYPYINKPCGMKHWLEHALGFPHQPINQDAIVVLLDPDQLITRPFRHNDFSNTEWMLVDDAPRTRITHGAPMGQRYGFYLQWKTKVRASYVFNTTTSPVDQLSAHAANAGYVVGPPYIATARDMYAICDLWCQITPRVHGTSGDCSHHVWWFFYHCCCCNIHKLTLSSPTILPQSRLACDRRISRKFYDLLTSSDVPSSSVSRIIIIISTNLCFKWQYLLAEMFAYCLAAAHLGLAHQTAASFMVSSTGVMKGEGWSYVDGIPDEKICQPNDIPEENLPNVLHFCQRYGWGPYFFGKRKLPHSFLSCESPLLHDPPDTLLTDYEQATFPGGNVKEFKGAEAKRNVFMVCYMIQALNEAAEYYKAQHCNSASANLKHSMILSQIK